MCERSRMGDLGWEDVGGLTETRQALQEVFISPCEISSAFINVDKMVYSSSNHGPSHVLLR